MTIQEISNEMIVMNSVAVITIGKDYSDKNPDNEHSILFKKLVSGISVDMFVVRKTVNKLIYSTQKLKQILK